MSFGVIGIGRLELGSFLANFCGWKEFYSDG